MWHRSYKRETEGEALFNLLCISQYYFVIFLLYYFIRFYMISSLFLSICVIREIPPVVIKKLFKIILLTITKKLRRLSLVSNVIIISTEIRYTCAHVRLPCIRQSTENCPIFPFSPPPNTIFFRRTFSSSVL